MKVLDLFSAAAGGWSLGMHRAGYRTIAACEVIDWRRALYSQNNPGVPVYDDVTTLTADRLVRDGVGLPDIIVGSPPCQDISSANTKGKGVDGERSGLYFEAVRLIDECRPRWFALENSANLRTRGADRIIDALAAIGYTCWPFVVSAGDIGANHERKRSWLIGFSLADANGIGRNAGWQGWRGGIDLSFQDDIGHTAGIGHESGRPRRHGQDGYCSPHSPRVISSYASGIRGASRAGHDISFSEYKGENGEQRPAVAGRTSTSSITTEPWADWNGGLAHHLRVDDGLSGWVAQSRIAIGGPRGTVAASLIVEAFGDAVLPQIPEAIGRAILRVEAALVAVSRTAANDNQERTIAAA
ncbi:MULTISPECIES: DNA cytosine methyltransferase [unclassified Mesorhizobium]|uniref:DNA cytosine methyltransferase n=1 Tax=unclassified Mesorhizobium TaxID=325217 RepID=UPI001AEE0BD8|nr:MULTISPECIES: DNA cytosine methyltransferase [unclassified Mesorhizobium]